MAFFLSLSLLSLLLGIYRLKGPVNVAYLGYGVIAKSGSYVAIPGAVFFGLTGLAMSPIVPENWKLTLLISGLLISVAGAVLSPWLFKPSWLKWLEREHSDVKHILQMEIEQEGQANWNNRINIQEELDAWVAEVRRKHRM